MQNRQIQNLQINPQRLWDTLMETARIGATPKGGICRLTLTDLDRQVRDWFKAQCEALGVLVVRHLGRGLSALLRTGAVLLAEGGRCGPAPGCPGRPARRAAWPPGPGTAR